MKKCIIRCTVTFFAIVIMLAGCADINPTEPSERSIEDMEWDMLQLVNEARAANGVGSLTMNATLRQMARDYSQSMRNDGFFDHVSPDGEDLGDRLSSYSVTYQYAGENIAWNENVSDPVETAHDDLMQSSGHRANILGSSFTRIGIGISQDGNKYWFTQVFVEPTTMECWNAGFLTQRR